LKAYVNCVRDDGKIDVSLRSVGYKKSLGLAKQILERLEEVGVLPVGDKSHPDEISRVFPGASKSAFKKAVANLYKKGLVKPAPDSVTFLKK